MNVIEYLKVKQEILLDLDWNLINNVFSKNEADRKLIKNFPLVASQFKRPPHPSLISQLVPKSIKNINDLKVDTNNAKDIQELKKNEIKKISNEIISMGLNNIKWTNLQDLPSMQRKDIQDLTEANFSFLGIKKNAPIFTIFSSRKGELLNTQLELNSVLGFLEKNAAPVFDGILEQTYKNIQNYEPLLKVYQNKNMVYLAVFEKDGQGFEGSYIYCFEKDPTYKLQNQQTIETNSQKRGIK